MTLLAALLAGAAAAVLGSRASPVARLGRPSGRRPGGPGAALTPARSCWLAATGVAAVLPSVTGVAIAAGLVLLGPPVLRRLEPRSARVAREQLARDLPVAMDLLAACLAGGADASRAAAGVGAALGGECGARFTAVAGALLAGSPPELAWAGLTTGHPDDPLAPTARLLARAAEGGAPVAQAVGRLAEDVRAEGRAQAQQAARRVGVLAVAPLGLCFLPAFVLLGVVPVVVGLAGPLLSGG